MIKYVFFLCNFPFPTSCWGASPRLWWIARAHSFHCYVISHCMTIQQFIRSPRSSRIFEFAYNVELLETVLLRPSWPVSFSAHLCMDSCWVYTQEWNCWVTGYTNVQFWEGMPNSFTKCLWSFLYSWQSLFFYCWQGKVKWVGFLMSYRFLGTKYLFTNTTWMSIK